MYFVNSKSVCFLGNAFPGAVEGSIVDSDRGSFGNVALYQHMFVEGSGAFIGTVGFRMTVNKDHIVGVVVLHPEVTASGGVFFYRTEVRVVTHGTGTGVAAGIT